MHMLSDIMILFAKPLDSAAMIHAKSTLMDAGRSVLVHQKENQSRVLIVKFEPHDIAPAALLAVLLDAGYDAKMSGG